MGELLDIKEYLDYLNNIISNRGQWSTDVLASGRCEKHHIKPRCFNGSNNKNNIIGLYSNEHYTAHKILAKSNPNCLQVNLAGTMMAFPKSKLLNRQYEITAEEYEQLRLVSSALGKNNKGKHWSDATRDKMRGRKSGCKGLTKNTSESLRIASEKISAYAKTRKGDRNPNGGNHKLSGKNNPARKSVICIDTGKSYDTITAAHIDTGANHRCIAACCNGVRKSAGGYHWKGGNDN